MTGKQLKEWAKQIPDDATVEQEEDRGYSYAKWKPLDPTSVRATLLFISTPPNDETIEEPTV